MKEGQKIYIIHSVALSEMHLDGLVGRHANIIEILKHPDGSIRGCWACLDGEPYDGEQEWYIPFSSFC